MSIKVEAKLGLKKEKFEHAQGLLEAALCQGPTGSTSLFGDLNLLGFTDIQTDAEGDLMGAAYISEGPLDLKMLTKLGVIASLLEPDSHIDFVLNGEKIRILLDASFSQGWTFLSSQIAGDYIFA